MEPIIQINMKMRELIGQSREAVKQVDDPKAQALLETAAEVLSGLASAFDHYEQKTEPAWRSIGETVEDIGAATDGAPD